jgi:hypothetical protein
VTPAYERQELLGRIARHLSRLGLERVGQEEVSMGVILARELFHPRPAESWHEDQGSVLWWRLPVEEPPHLGTPLDDDFPDGVYTHWTPYPVPLDAASDSPSPDERGVP